MTSILNHALADRQAGNPNLIVDGDFRFWFEGTSQTTSGYGSDTMWQNVHSDGSKTASRQSFLLGQTNVPSDSGYFSRTDFTVPATPAVFDYCLKRHNIEGVDTLAGKTATLSFWAKADVEKSIAVEFEQSFGTGGTPSGNVTSIDVNTVNLTTSWQKFSLTVAIPSVSGKTLGTDNNDFLRLAFWFFSGTDFDSRTNAIGFQSGTVDIAHVKLEEGPVATEGGWRNEAEELALVQRYFFSNNTDNYGNNSTDSSSNPSRFCRAFPVSMRDTPTGTLGNLSGSAGNTGINGVSDESVYLYNSTVGEYTHLPAGSTFDARL